jgi:hypothetical protein
VERCTSPSHNGKGEPLVSYGRRAVFPFARKASVCSTARTGNGVNTESRHRTREAITSTGLSPGSPNWCPRDGIRCGSAPRSSPGGNGWLSQRAPRSVPSGRRPGEAAPGAARRTERVLAACAARRTRRLGAAGASRDRARTAAPPFPPANGSGVLLAPSQSWIVASMVRRRAELARPPLAWPVCHERRTARRFPDVDHGPSRDRATPMLRSLITISGGEGRAVGWMLDRIGHAATSSLGRPSTCVNSWWTSSSSLPI